MCNACCFTGVNCAGIAVVHRKRYSGTYSGNTHIIGCAEIAVIAGRSIGHGGVRAFARDYIAAVFCAGIVVITACGRVHAGINARIGGLIAYCTRTPAVYTAGPAGAGVGTIAEETVIAWRRVFGLATYTASISHSADIVCADIPIVAIEIPSAIADPAPIVGLIAY